MVKVEQFRNILKDKAAVKRRPVSTEDSSLMNHTCLQSHLNLLSPAKHIAVLSTACQWDLGLMGREFLDRRPNYLSGP